MTVHQDWDQVEPRDISTFGAPAWAWGTPSSAAAMTPGKRVFDMTLAAILLIPLSVVMATVALLLLICQGRPILYAAPRMRSVNEGFTQWKFRTMVSDEDDRGASGAHKDWRITRIGRVLRRTRIDELPQLFNILLGDMSFVGPRPPLREYVERFPSVYARVLQARPGVTGLATMIYHRHEDRIMARCGTPEATEAAYYRRCLPAKLRIDMIYLRRRTLALDLWILWHTVRSVIAPRAEMRPRRRVRQRDAAPVTAALASEVAAPARASVAVSPARDPFRGYRIFRARQQGRR